MRQTGELMMVVRVGLSVGPVRKVLTVTGDRAVAGGGYSAPRPFRTMPIVWERAYGGTPADGSGDVRNPVGIGYRGAASADPAVRSEAPNVTYAGEEARGPADRPRPAGFGAVGRGWRPRIGLAGTYDQAWIDEQWPLPPRDFDPRHNLCAPADQQLPALEPGTAFTLVNLTPEGRWQFRLPRKSTLRAQLKLVYDDRVEDRGFAPDTVLIEPDLRRVTLKARLAFVTRRNAPALREIVFGYVSPVWLNARRKRKAYLNPLGGDGTLTDRPTWAP